MKRSMLSRRAFLKTTAFSAAGLVLAACAAPAAPGAGSATGGAAPAGEAVEIIHFDRNIPQDIDFRKELADRFHEANPNLTVKIEVMPDDYAATLITRIASGTAGDCFRYGTHYGLANLALRGIFYALDDYVAQDGYDLSVYFKGSIDACRVEGKLYALPVNGHPGWSAIYYMPELFTEAGVAEPTDKWTYDDMTQAARSLTKASSDQIDQYGLWVAPYYEASLTPIDAFGGWPMDETGTKARFDDPNTIAGVQWIRDTMQEYKVALPNPSFDSRVQLWSSGKVAMVLSGIWEGSYLGDATPEGKSLKVATGPIGPSGHRGGFVGVNVFPILQNSKHPYETWQWQKFICSKEVGIENVKRIGEPGLRTDVWEDPSLSEDPLVKPHYELLQVVKPMPVPANGRLSEIADPVQQIYTAIWLNEISVEDGCAQIQEKLQAILDQPKPGA
ncbi:MAG TPA: sugar ABC transporter substrate-binding protein [Caldilineaceae bacterium]|nr:sugar ABC transporter substrate-binding protein [Caldilineaceae bacterium]